MPKLTAHQRAHREAMRKRARKNQAREANDLPPLPTTAAGYEPSRPAAKPGKYDDWPEWARPTRRKRKALTELERDKADQITYRRSQASEHIPAGTFAERPNALPASTFVELQRRYGAHADPLARDHISPRRRMPAPRET